MKDEQGNPTGGLSDRGLLVSFFMVLEFANASGVSTVQDKSDATFEAGENDFGSYFDCRSINELADILEGVRVRLQE